MTDWHKFLIENQEDIAADCAERGVDFTEELEALADVYRLLSDERLQLLLGDPFQRKSAERAEETGHVIGYTRLMAKHGHSNAQFSGLKLSKSNKKSRDGKRASAFAVKHGELAKRMAVEIHKRHPGWSYTDIRRQIIKELANEDISVGDSTLKAAIKNPRRLK